MRSPRRLVTVLTGVALMITATGCQASTPPTQGSTMTAPNSQMPNLPEDQDAAKAVVRAMVVKEAAVLFKASGLKFTNAQFDVPTSYDQDNAQNGDLLITIQPCSDRQVQAMTAAIRANGWAQGGVSHSVNVHKGPLYLQWNNTIDGCRFEITTVNITQHMRITDDIFNVQELAAFKAVG